MEEDYKKLYEAVSGKFNIGTFEEFSSRMQTPEDRQKFYNVVSDKGFDLGDYESYENRLKKKDVTQPSANQSSVSTSSVISSDSQDGSQSETVEVRDTEVIETPSFDLKPQTKEPESTVLPTPLSNMEMIAAKKPVYNIPEGLSEFEEGILISQQNEALANQKRQSIQEQAEKALKEYSEQGLKLREKGYDFDSGEYYQRNTLPTLEAHGKNFQSQIESLDQKYKEDGTTKKMWQVQAALDLMPEGDREKYNAFLNNPDEAIERYNSGEMSEEEANKYKEFSKLAALQSSIYTKLEKDGYNDLVENLNSVSDEINQGLKKYPMGNKNIFAQAGGDADLFIKSSIANSALGKFTDWLAVKGGAPEIDWSYQPQGSTGFIPNEVWRDVAAMGVDAPLFQLGGAIGGSVGKLAGQTGKVLGSSAGAFGTFGTAGDLAQQLTDVSEEGSSIYEDLSNVDWGQVGKTALKEAAIGAAVPIGKGLGGKMLQLETENAVKNYLSKKGGEFAGEVATFGTVSPLLHGELPSIESLADATEFMIAMKLWHIPQKLRKGISDAMFKGEDFKDVNLTPKEFESVLKEAGTTKEEFTKLVEKNKELTEKGEIDDKENEIGLSSKEQIGEKPVEEKSKQETSRQEAETSRVLQEERKVDAKEQDTGVDGRKLESVSKEERPSAEVESRGEKSRVDEGGIKKDESLKDTKQKESGATPTQEKQQSVKTAPVVETEKSEPSKKEEKGKEQLSKEEQRVADKMAEQKKAGKKLSGTKKDFDVYENNKKAIDAEVERQMKEVSEKKKSELKQQQKVEDFARRVGKEGKKNFSESDEKFYAENKEAIDKLVPEFQKEPPKDKSKTRSLAQKIHSGKTEFTEAEQKTFSEFESEVMSELKAIEKAEGEASRKTVTKDSLKSIKRPRRKVTVDEYAALKDQIRLEAKAANQGAKSERDKQKGFSKAIKDSLKDLKKKGKVTTSQLNQLANAARNVRTEKQFEKFLDTAEKIMKDAEYGEKIKKANSFRKTMKSALKNKKLPSNYRELINQLKGIKPQDVDIDLYNKVAEALSNSAKNLRVKLNKETGEYEAVDAERAVSDNKLKSNIEKLREEQRQSDIASLMKGEKGLSKKEATEVVDGFNETKAEKEINRLQKEEGLTLEQAESEYVKKLEAEYEGKKEKVVEFVQEKVNELETDSKTKFIKDIDLSKLDVVDLLRVEKVVDNINKNNDNSFIADLRNIKRSQEGVSSISKIKKRPSYKKKQTTKFVRNTSSFLERVTGSKNVTIEILEAIGYNELRRQMEKYKQEKNRVKTRQWSGEGSEENRLNNVVNEAAKKDPSVRTEKGEAERNFYSFLKQKIEFYKSKGVSEEKAIKDFKDSVETTIETLRNLQGRYGKLYEKIQELYDEKIKDLKSIDDWKMSEAQHDIRNEVIKLFEQHFPSYEEYMLESHGKQLEKFPEYTTMSIKDSNPFSGITPNINLSSLGRLMGIKAAGAHERKLLNPISKNQMIDPRFESVQLRELHKQRRSAHLDEVIQSISEMLTSQELIDLIGLENRNTLRQRIESDINNDLVIRRAEEIFGNNKTAYGSVNSLKNLGSLYVFGNPVFQFIKQFPSAYGASTVNMIVDNALKGNFSEAMIPLNLPRVYSDMKNAIRSGVMENSDVFRRDTKKEHLDPFSRYFESSKKAQGLLKKRKDTSKAISDVLLSGLKIGDKIPARAAFSNFYVEYMSKNGNPPPKEAKAREQWWNEEGKKLEKGDDKLSNKALAYATRSVERDQNVSAKEYGSYFQKMSDDARTALFKNIVVPFTSFKANYDAGVLNSIAKLRMGALQKDRGMITEGTADLMGKATETAVFAAAGTYIIPMISSAMFSLLGGSDEGYDEIANDEFKKRKFWGKIVKDATPFMFLEGMGAAEIDMINKGYYELVADKNKYPTYQDFKKIASEDLPLYTYHKNPQKSNPFDYAGQVGIALSGFYEASKYFAREDRSEYIDEYGNKKYLSKEQVATLDKVNAFKLLQGVGLMFGEAGYAGREFEKDINKRKFNNAYERYVKAGEGDLSDIILEDVKDKSLGADARISRTYEKAVKKYINEYDEFLDRTVRIKDPKQRALKVYNRYKKLPMELRQDFYMSTIVDVAIREGEGAAESMVKYFNDWIKYEESKQK